MGLAAVISIGITVLLLVFSLAFKVAGKLRLGLPLLYFVAALVSTFFTDWTSEHEDMVLLGLYILLGIVAFSWVYSLVKAIRQKHQERQYEKAFQEDVAWQIERARELGITVNQIVIKDDGTVLHADTGEPILPIQNHGRPV